MNRGTLERPRTANPARATEDSVTGNERLTAFAGALLFVLIGIEGITLLGVQQMLTLHEFVGVLVAGPIVLKLGATGWRFVRYYTGEPAYRRKGPPWLPLRLLAPVLIVSTVTLIGSGIGLWAYGHDAGGLLFLHKASFVVWIAVSGVHVLYYMWRVPALLVADLHRRVPVPRGRAIRLGIVVASLVVGTVLALLTVGGHAGFRHRDDGRVEQLDDR